MPFHCTPNSTYRRRAALMLFPVCLLQGQATSPVQLVQQTTPPANERLSYGKNLLQFGELRLPAGTGPFPVVILVHGGCWEVKLGTLPESVTSFELLRPIAAALATGGIASWNVEYRRLGNEGGGWPGTYQDLSSATDYLRELAPRYHLDLHHVIALGHSSGGQLAVWLGARGKLPKSSILYTSSPLPLNGVVSVDGPPDLEADRAIDQSSCGAPVIAQFVGGTPAEFPDRYREGSASGLLPIGTKQEIFVSTTLGEKWSTLFKQYAAAAAKAGDPVRLLTMDGANHFDGINPQAPAWQAVVASIQSLVGIH